MNSLWLALAVGFQCKIFGLDYGCCLYVGFSITNPRDWISVNRKRTEKKNTKIISKVNIKDVLLREKIYNEFFLINHSKRIIICSVHTEKCVS